MTTLDPSHFPWRAHDDDPTKGGAVHTSVRAPFASTSRYAEEASSSEVEEESASSDDGEDIDADQHAEHFRELKRRRRARKQRKRLDHEDARAHGRIPTIPVPDVRFEQSYLMSIQPFIHSQPIQASILTSSDTEDTEKTPSKARMQRDKRRRVEESLALVDDPASRKGSPLDDLLHPSSERQVSIQWSQIAYITMRDQVFSPLVQGALWALGGIILSSVYTGWKTRYPAAPREKSARGNAGLRGYLSRLVGPALAGIRAGPA